MNSHGARLNRASADDGDELRFCSTCAFSDACLSQGYGKPELEALHVLVEHVGPYHEGDVIFREGEEFKSIAAVRAGTVKRPVAMSYSACFARGSAACASRCTGCST